MLSSRLIRMIEDHWDPITNRIMADIRQDHRLRHIASLPASDLRDRTRDILQRLGHWLSVSKPEELAQRFQQVGASRHEEGIPLAEVVLGHVMIKDRMLAFVRDQGIGDSPVAIYAEEELEHCVGRFFDSAIYHLIVGYEGALPAPMSRARHAGSAALSA